MVLRAIFKYVKELIRYGIVFATLYSVIVLKIIAILTTDQIQKLNPITTCSLAISRASDGWLVSILLLIGSSS